MSKIADAIIAAAQAIAHRMRVVNRFVFVEGFAIGCCSLPMLHFTTSIERHSHLKREIASQFDLQTVRWSLESCSRTLIIDYEEITIRPIDVTKTHVDE